MAAARKCYAGDVGVGDGDVVKVHHADAFGGAEIDFRGCDAYTAASVTADFINRADMLEGACIEHHHAAAALERTGVAVVPCLF